MLMHSMLQAVPLESNEGGILTERLAGYAQEAPVLDAWLARFPTLCHHLPAQRALPEVAAAVDGVAKRILASKAAVLAIKVSLVAPASLTWAFRHKHTACCSLSGHAVTQQLILHVITFPGTGQVCQVQQS